MLLQLLLLLWKIVWRIVTHVFGTIWWSWTLDPRSPGSGNVEGGVLLRLLHAKLTARKQQVS